MYDSKKNKQADLRTAPPPPEDCQVAGCKNKTVVSFMRVFNKDKARSEVGGAGGGASDVNGKRGAYAYTSNNQIVMADKYDYIGWVTRCGGCYQLDLKGQGNRAVDLCREHAKNIQSE